jgi:hypothetical protein
VLDNLTQGREIDPSEYLPDDEVDATFARLLGEAPETDRAKLNALNPDERRKVAKLYLDQKKDDEPSPLDAADNRTVKCHPRL